MGTGMDKKTEKVLLDALTRLKADNQRMRDKRELQIWKKINVTCKLVDILGTFTKDDLHDIRKNLGFEGLSSLKKAELIDELAKQIPANFKNALSLLDLNTYHLIKKVANNSGVTVAPKDFSTEDAELLMGYGLVFPGTYQEQKVLVMPQEIVDTFIEMDGFELQKVVHRNDEWIHLTHGMLNYYGTLSTPLLIKKLTEFTNQEINWRQYFDVMTFACEYYGQVKFNAHGFLDHRVFDAEKLKEEHKIRDIIDYYPFTKIQILKAAEPQYVEKTLEMKNWIQFMMEHFKLSSEKMDEIAWEVISLINLDADTSELLQHLQTRFEMDSLVFIQKLADKLVVLHNHTRMWILKGYTPNELSQLRRNQSNPFQAAPQEVSRSRANVVDINSHKKTGRNQPCPCGSGKKYKKCCGK